MGGRWDCGLSKLDHSEIVQIGKSDADAHLAFEMWDSLDTRSEKSAPQMLRHPDRSIAKWRDLRFIR